MCTCIFFSLTKLPSAINPVTTLSVDYSCSSHMVTVTWGLVFGANMYRASAVDGTGASLNCTSATGSCHITMLKCGEKYEVHVTAISDDCESRSNTSALFETGGCGPLCSCYHKYMVCMAKETQTPSKLLIPKRMLLSPSGPMGH